jgi:hypothetical protein
VRTPHSGSRRRGAGAATIALGSPGPGRRARAEPRRPTRTAARRAWHAARSGAGTWPGVVIVQGLREWPAELLSIITSEGYTLLRLEDVRLTPFFVLAGGVAAVLVDERGLELLGMLALRKCRECSPDTAVVVMAREATAPAVKRALESGATAFLSWSASPEALLRAIRGGPG